MAATDTPAAPGKGAFIVALGAMTLLAIGGGALVGKLIAGRAKSNDSPPAAVLPVEPPHYTMDNEVHELPAVVTNLATPSAASVRLQVAVVFPKKATENPALLLAQLGDDLVAFMKTVTLKDIQGPSGLQNFREDLKDRVVTRSEGKVTEVIIEGLVIQ